MRHAIRIDGIYRPLLATSLGARHDTAYVDLDGSSVVIRFGWWVHETIDRSQVESAAKAPWSIWRGVGVRLTLRGGIGLIGSRTGVVELRLREPHIVRWLPLPWRPTYRHIFISLEDPDAFLADPGVRATSS